MWLRHCSCTGLQLAAGAGILWQAMVAVSILANGAFRSVLTSHGPGSVWLVPACADGA